MAYRESLEIDKRKVHYHQGRIAVTINFGLCVGCCKTKTRSAGKPKREGLRGW